MFSKNNMNFFNNHFFVFQLRQHEVTLEIQYIFLINLNSSHVFIDSTILLLIEYDCVFVIIQNELWAISIESNHYILTRAAMNLCNCIIIYSFIR